MGITTKADAGFADREPEPEDETLKEYLTRKVDAIFIDNIPLDAIKELPRKYMYLLGFLAHSLSITCFM
jgi:hypothetical protein